MKIAYDARLINNSGIGTTIRGFLAELDSTRKEKLTVLAHDRTPLLTGFDSVPVRDSIYSLNQHWRYAYLLSKMKPALFHMPHFDVPYFYRGPLVATVHDLIHLIFPQHSTKRFSEVYAKAMVSHVAKTARRIIVDSENTKKDLVKFHPMSEEKIRIIYPGVGSAFSPAIREKVLEVRKRYQLPEDYFLYVGNIRGSKNTPGLIKAYQQFRQSHHNVPPLVLVGKNSLPEYNNGFPEGIISLGVVNDEVLPTLYSAASLFIFPSFYEGFGLPPLEAMSCGTPVLSSNQASLPEVCGNAVVYFDPYSIDSMVDALKNTWSSKEKLLQMREQGFAQAKKFTWGNFANQTWAVYEEVLRETGQTL